MHVQRQLQLQPTPSWMLLASCRFPPPSPHAAAPPATLRCENCSFWHRFQFRMHLVRLLRRPIAQANANWHWQLQSAYCGSGVKYLKATSLQLSLTLVVVAISKRATEAHFVVMSRCHVAMFQLAVAVSSFQICSCRCRLAKGTAKADAKSSAMKFVNGTLTLSYQDVSNCLRRSTCKSVTFRLTPAPVPRRIANYQARD